MLKSMFFLFTPVLLGQTPYQSQSVSTIAVSVKDDAKVVRITNVAFEVTGSDVPGLPVDQRLVLRKTMQLKQVIGDVGTEAAMTVEAWPLDAGLKKKPLYSLRVSGDDVKIVNGELIQFSRGLEEVEWWSVYKLGSGAHLFDTYVPPVVFSINRETQALRYVGLEVPPDDSKDPRLKAPYVVAVLTYAAADHVIREALLTCSDPIQAKLLRSYADTARTVMVVGEESKALKISISQSYPSAPATVTIQVPLAKDDLDLAHAQLPAGLSIAAWKR